MTALRGLLAAAICTLTTLALVVGVGLPASAGTFQYYSGYITQNEVKFSLTTSTVGGRVVMDPVNRVVTVRATVAGLGSYASVGTLSYTHARRTTYAYCKWTSDYVQGVRYHLACSLST